MRAKDAKEWMEVWSEEVQRANILWHSIPTRHHGAFNEFIGEYKEWVGIACIDTFGPQSEEFVEQWSEYFGMVPNATKEPKEGDGNGN